MRVPLYVPRPAGRDAETRISARENRQFNGSIAGKPPRVSQDNRAGAYSCRDFCERKGIKKSSLDYWFKKVRQAAVEPAFVEVQVAAALSRSDALEVIVAGKYRIQIHGAFDSELFAQVVRALESLA